MNVVLHMEFFQYLLFTSIMKALIAKEIRKTKKFYIVQTNRWQMDFYNALLNNFKTQQ